MRFWQTDSKTSQVANLLLPLALTAFLPSTSAFKCLLTASSITYDLNPLGDLRTANSETDTPPTKSAARLRMDLCGKGVGSEDEIDDEDQCPSNARVCLKLTNIKPPHAERVTSVVPFWLSNTPDDDITTSPMGTKGQDGLKISVQGPDYAGTPQYLNLTLRCDKSSSAADPSFVSYTGGHLSLEWSTPDACPRDGDYEGEPDTGNGDDEEGDNGGIGKSSGGLGFFGFMRFLFWIVILGLIGYFAIGIFYNRQQYSASGWDMIPHRDFWREVPILARDLTSHIFTNVRNSGPGGRGGYSSLG